MLISVNHCFFIDQTVSSELIAAIFFGLTTAILLGIMIALERHSLRQKLAKAYHKLRGLCRQCLLEEQQPLVQHDGGGYSENHQNDRNN